MAQTSKVCSMRPALAFQCCVRASGCSAKSFLKSLRAYGLVTVLIYASACAQNEPREPPILPASKSISLPLTLAHISRDPAGAEATLRDKLTADPFVGAIRNNLGVALLQQGKFFEAATEFEIARKLMPGHPDPRLNLGLTFERASRTKEAIASYESALEISPEHIPAKQALARLRLLYAKRDDHTKQLVQDIAIAGDSAAWRQWARFCLVAWENE